LAGENLTFHVDEEAGRVLDLKALVDDLSHDEPLYICGPRPMIKAAMNEAKALGWPKDRLRFELFFTVADAPPEAVPAPAPVDDGSFEVEIKSTGAVFRVPKDKSIIDVLVDAGVDPLFDCNKGECGVCQCGVIAGVPDHRDSILSDAERAAGKIMQICVSRSKSPRLVLDL
ncbi:MAG: flavin reductase family protein, partial [Albidovulum sp.]